MALRNLHPGAAYQLKVFAISHGLLSEPHDYFQAVCKIKSNKYNNILIV